jgi:hypothetical protein
MGASSTFLRAVPEPGREGVGPPKLPCAKSVASTSAGSAGIVRTASAPRCGQEGAHAVAQLELDEQVCPVARHRPLSGALVRTSDRAQVDSDRCLETPEGRTRQLVRTLEERLRAAQAGD